MLVAVALPAEPLVHLDVAVVHVQLAGKNLRYSASGRWR